MKHFFQPRRWAAALAVATMLLISSCGNPVSQFVSSGTAVDRSVSGPKAAGANNTWFTQSSIYQIFPATFSSQGNLAGVTAQMDYIKDLGVKTIWLMPIFQAMNTHGYDVTNYYSIASSYGSAQSLTDLVTAAHARDIRVVLDLVVNHTGTGIQWFSDPNPANRHDNWYIWADHDLGWDDPWNWNTATNQFGKTWIRDPYPDYDRNGNGNLHDDDYYYSVFGDAGAGTMPDLNWKGAQTAVTNEVVNVMKYWIDTSNVDGYRCDAARYLTEDGPGQQADLPLTHTIWQSLRSQLSAYAPGAVLIAEAPTETYPAMKAYYGSNATPEFNSAFHFKYSGTLMGTLKNSWYDGSFFPDLFAIQSNLPTGGVDTLFLSNHDSFTGDRVATQLANNTGKIKLAGSLYITLSGNPATYYGEEYGIQNTPGQSGDTAIRGPMDWNAIATQKADTSSVLNHYRALYTLRNTYDALRGGITYAARSNGSSGWADYSTPGNHVAWVREYFGEKILVVHNLTANAMNINVDLPSTGLTFADNTPVTVIMGGGTLANITTANQSNYDLGSVGGYVTKIVYLGALPAKYNGLTYDIARTAAWSGGSTGWPSLFVRGTNNAWGTTAMTKTNGVWSVNNVAFGSAAGQGFKFDVYGDWTVNYGGTALTGTAVLSGGNIPVASNATYNITFNESTKAYAATLVTASTYSISGTVNGTGNSGVTVTAGSATATTDASGNYTLSSLANGTYTVTPSKSGYTFTPASTSVTVNGANVTGTNFTIAAIPTYSISGNISGTGNSGVTVTAGTKTATSDASGNYTITGLTAATYTVTPTKSGLTFTPASTSVTVSSANVTGVNFAINSGSTGKLTINLKANGTAQNVKFPGDFNAWNINTTNAINVAANTTGTLVLNGVVITSNITQGSSTTALELQVINVVGGGWANNWGFASWTKVGCSVPDGKQITIPCTNNQNVTLTIDVTTTTLTATVQ